MSSDRLLVYMRARDAASSLDAALGGILAQNGVDLQVIIVDDASTDGTTPVVEAARDPRVRLVRSDRRLDRPRCRELVLDLSDARFVVEIAAPGVALPGALKRLLDTCAASSEIGLAHCYYFDADEEGRVGRDAYRAQRKYFQQLFGPEGDLRRALLQSGNVVGPLRLFRREALEGTRGRCPTSKSAADLVSMVSLADRFEIVTVPEYLFCRRLGPSERRRSRLRRLVDATRQALACRRALAGTDGLYRRGGYDADRLLATRLYRVSGLGRIPSSIARVKRLPRRYYWRTIVPLTERIYYAGLERFAPAAGRLLPPAPRADRHSERRIAYYIWHFPVLSQTFVNRELAALKKAGVCVEVMAEGPEDIALADHNAQSLLENTTYLHPPEGAALTRYTRFFRLHRPVAYFRAFLFVLACRYAQQKRLDGDRLVFRKAVHLAGVLRERNVTHIHAPWADRCALIALVAARLLGIPYSVQARAHEIHRRPHQYGLRECLEPAAFIVTNTEYNERHLRSLLREGRDRTIHVINNGIDLERFEPGPRVQSASRPARVLTVARLIEQKGLLHLLTACRALLERGVDLTCEIIGGAEEPLYTAHLLQLKRLHRQLQLESRVHFLGARPLGEVIRKYRDTNLFVLPCVVAADGARDIIPNSLIEAMAMRLPVISTTVGGVPEIVEDGVSGLLVPPGNPGALADAMEMLIQDPRRAAELGAGARRRVEAKFDIDENVRHYIQLFSEGAATSRAGAVAAPGTLTPESADR